MTKFLKDPETGERPAWVGWVALIIALSIVGVYFFGVTFVEH